MQQNLVVWVKSIKLGHKRLWLLISSLWFATAMYQPVRLQLENYDYCNKLIQNSSWGVRTHLDEETYIRCSFEQSEPIYPTGQHALTSNATYFYTITGTKFGASSFLKGLILGIALPVALPMIIYILIRLYR